jgi:hypothetical protein
MTYPRMNDPVWRDARTTCLALAGMNLRPRLTDTGIEYLAPPGTGPSLVPLGGAVPPRYQPRDQSGQFTGYLLFINHVDASIYNLPGPCHRRRPRRIVD